MDKLHYKYENLLAAYQAFKRIIDKFELVRKGELHDEDDIIRDSAIKRFEFTIDTLWKYLKRYLVDVKGRSMESSSPKPIFRECFNDGLITEEETVLAITMVDSRNMTSHTYKDEVANEIGKHLHNYFLLMEKIIQKTKPQ